MLDGKTRKSKGKQNRVVGAGEASRTLEDTTSTILRDGGSDCIKITLSNNDFSELGEDFFLDEGSDADDDVDNEVDYLTLRLVLRTMAVSNTDWVVTIAGQQMQLLKYVLPSTSFQLSLLSQSNSAATSIKILEKYFQVF